MLRRSMIGTLFLLAVFALLQSSSAGGTQTVGRTRVTVTQARAAERKAIEQLPLLMRPDRLGHIYGNTVRRIYRSRHGA